MAVGTVTAIGEVLALPTEPPIGAVVIGSDGTAWQRIDDPSEGDMWRCTEDGYAPRGWSDLLGDFGPLTVVHLPEVTS